MNSMYFEKNGYKYNRVNRKAAIRLYNAGETIGMLPSRMNPESIWAHIAHIYRDNPNDVGRDFDKWENEFRYYNCTPQLGSRINYFVVTV